MSPRVITLDEPVLAVNCMLGEGPIWDARAGVLHFIDITEKTVYHWRPGTGLGDLKMDQLDEMIGCLALRRKGGLACATKQGFALIQHNSDGSAYLEHLVRPLEHDPQREAAQRFNDGACDAMGRFFAGTLTMDSNSFGKPHGYGGQLWCYDPLTSQTRLVDDDVLESNGLGWSADNKTLYFTDSFRRIIFAYDYDLQTGSVSNKRPYIDASSIRPDRLALPDGLCFDSKGGVWSASWAGSQVTRFAPNGSIDIVISIPSAWHVTACCFGGPNLDQLYITTASPLVPGGDPKTPELDRPALAREHHNSGHLFVVDFHGEFKEGVSRHGFAG